MKVTAVENYPDLFSQKPLGKWKAIILPFALETSDFGNL